MRGSCGAPAGVWGSEASKRLAGGRGAREGGEGGALPALQKTKGSLFSLQCCDIVRFSSTVKEETQNTLYL